MNKIRVLRVVNIIQIVLLVAAIVATVIIMPKIMLFEEDSKIPTGGNGGGSTYTRPLTVIDGTDADIYNGYADVMHYGAKPDDGKDDTEAFMKAAATGAGVYVPIGTFEISKTINLEGQTLKGAGTELSKIVFKGDGAIVNASGAALVDDITLTFADDSITGKEGEGEKVAIYDGGITTGAMIRCVTISNVGTAIYSPERDDMRNTAITLESVIIDRFTYKAIDMKTAASAVFRSIFIREPKNDVETAVTLGGIFSIENMAFQGSKANYPLEFKNATAATVRTLVFKDTTAGSDAYIRSSSSFLSLQTVTITGSTGSALIKVEDPADGAKTAGKVSVLYSDDGAIAVDGIDCDDIVF